MREKRFTMNRYANHDALDIYKLQPDLDVLYKYGSLQKDAPSRRLLFDRELYFSSTKQFNDPFESRIPLNFKNLNAKKMARASVEKKYHGHPRAFRRSMTKQREKTVKSYMNDPETPKKLQKYFENDWGIASLSEDPLSILMWSHYGMKHTGFCVGIRARKLYECINQQSLCQNIHIFWRKVKYVNQFPIISPTDEDLIVETELLALTQKAQCWEYEKEHRLLSKGHVTQPIVLPPDIICEIYLGWQSDDDDRRKVIEIAKELYPTARVTMLKNKGNAFELIPV